MEEAVSGGGGEHGRSDGVRWGWYWVVALFVQEVVEWRSGDGQAVVQDMPRLKSGIAFALVLLQWVSGVMRLRGSSEHEQAGKLYCRCCCLCCLRRSHVASAACWCTTGAHGPGAVAGQEHGTDQEAQSGRRLRPRQRSRPSPAASPVPPSAEPHRWADLDAEGAAAFGGEGGAAAGTGERRPGARRRRHLQAELDGEAGAGDAGNGYGLPQGGRPRRSGSAPSQ